MYWNDYDLSITLKFQKLFIVIFFFFFMNKKGQWNVGVGMALILSGVYVLTLDEGINIAIAILLMAGGAWLVFK